VQGDVITALDGNTIDAASTLGSVMQHESPNKSVEVDYLDQFGTPQTTTVTLGTGPAQ
jgi:S1-C subfamily serine protease